MRITGLILLLVATAASLFYFYPDLAQTEQVRYRLTVAIDTPTGPREGTGVWGYSMAPTFDVPVFSFQWNFAGRVDGEAIPIDIGQNRRLYMVMGGRTMPKREWAGFQPARFTNGFMNSMPRHNLWTEEAPDFYSGRAGADAEVAWFKAQRGRIVTLQCSPQEHRNDTGECPAIVLADSSGLHISMLDPDDFAATLGFGYHLRSVTLEVVDDPVSHGIETQLPWVRAVPIRAFHTSEEELKATGFSRHDPARW